MAIIARKIILSGRVQGVGFRPFIYRLAVAHKLTGSVKNRVGLVEIFVQGAPQNIQSFIADIFSKKPPLANPVLNSDVPADVSELASFSIERSQQGGEASISVPVDLFLCDDCLAELNDPADRRYHYPFINCTQCGPRYTLIRALPYDRPNTTMADFELCPSCLAEYKDPVSRRFHAEPVACPVCGPSLTFTGREKQVDDNAQAIQQTVAWLQAGKVIAVKGIGGYHLMCDATNGDAVSRLRNNKPRPHKPLAVMFPAPANNPFSMAELSVTLSEQDKTFLCQPARPILLVMKKQHAVLAEQIAPGLNEVGMMLPYSPLHHLLLDAFGGPLVATSANISGEPVLTDNGQVENRLGHVADAFLHHNRPIERPADDPVFRTIAGKPRPLRTGRGVAPIELTLPFELDRPVIAVGAQMKNTVTLAWKNRAVLSPHIGEMDTARSLEIFDKTVADLQRLYEVKAETVVCDAHPGYTTTRWADRQSLPVQTVYHHQAHASAAYFECHAAASAGESIIVFTWDGVGYGDDSTLQGGETFLGKPGQWQRVASMRHFNLPGGDKAAREPGRCAAALCWEAGFDYDNFPGQDRAQFSMLRQAWQRKMNAPQTSSVGRLFDAAAALTGVCTLASFEGQGPMQLEALCESGHDSSAQLVELELVVQDNLLITDWKSLIPVISDSALSVSERAAVFHNSLAHAMLQQAKTIRQRSAVNRVSFSGGVFQNRVLTEQAMALLAAAGFEVFLPELIPVNDAGISFGQIIEYGYRKKI